MGHYCCTLLVSKLNLKGQIYLYVLLQAFFLVEVYHVYNLLAKFTKQKT